MTTTESKNNPEIPGPLTKSRRVWDLPLRLFHWLIALCFAGLWLTAELGVNWMEWHFRLGYLTGFLLIYRLIWGFVGSRHARFASFLPSFRGFKAYLRAFFSKTHPIVSVGHNPVGALMVFALLLVLSLQVITGLFTTDDIFSAGPLNAHVSEDVASFMGAWHHRLSTLIKVFVGLHIFAVVFYLVFKKQNLTRAMISGKKPAADVPKTEEIPGPMGRRGLAVAVISLAIFAGLAIFIRLLG